MFGWFRKSKGADQEKTVKAAPKVEGSQTENGTVENFGTKFGFVTTDKGQKVFVHSSVYPKGETLQKGAKVQVVYGKAPKGMQATEVRKI